MKGWRFTSPPHALDRASVKLDNLAILPVRLLPYKQQWQALANQLPQGGEWVTLQARRFGGQVQAHGGMVPHQGRPAPPYPSWQLNYKFSQ
jgi:hypothetical protein